MFSGAPLNFKKISIILMFHAKQCVLQLIETQAKTLPRLLF